MCADSRENFQLNTTGYVALLYVVLRSNRRGARMKNKLKEFPEFVKKFKRTKDYTPSFLITPTRKQSILNTITKRRYIENKYGTYDLIFRIFNKVSIF